MTEPIGASKATGKFKEMLLKISLEGLVTRLLCAWAVMGVFQNLFAGENITFEQGIFFQKYNFRLSLLIFGVSFLLLLLPVFKNKLRYILWTSFLSLFCLTLWQREDFGYYLGAVLVMVIVSLYAFKDCEFKKDIRTGYMWAAAVPFTALVVTVMCVVTILMYKAYWSPTFDMGIFSQMFYYMKETLIPYATCERDKLLSHFAVHFSPIYYLLLPVYMVFPSPITLLVAQAIISASGVIPLILLAKKYNHSNLTALLLSFCYMGIPAITGGNLYYLHENVFLSPLLLWLFYFAEKKNIPLTFVFATLVMLVKEDAPVYVAVFGIYLMLSKRNIKLGAALSVFSVVYFVTVLGILSAFGEGAMVSRFNNFILEGEPVSLVGVIMTAFSNPAYLISECFESDRILFLIQLFLPVMFMPFFTKKFSRLILFVPVVLINLMSDNRFQHSMEYQYVFGSLAFVIYLTVMNSADLDRAFRSKMLVIAAASSVMIFFSMYYYRIGIIGVYEDNMKEHDTIAQSLELIPDDASVAASTFFVANLSQRDVIYELETTKNKAEYYVLDLRYDSKEYSVEEYLNENYEVVCINEYVGIFKAKE